ncbi:MAG: sigma-70 family RNA polymerase sigma factor [Pedobacter sp.]
MLIKLINLHIAWIFCFASIQKTLNNFVSNLDPASLFKDNLNTINSAIFSVCKRYGILGDDAEDLGQDIRLTIIADDYRRLRGFRNESSLTTFLYTVINNIFIDQYRKRRGRWRHSEKAMRLGQEAVLLERYCYRDGLPLHEGIEILRTNHGSSTPEEVLHHLFAQIPCKTPRPIPAGEVSIELPDSISLADEQLHIARRDKLKEHLEAMILEMEEDFSDDERLILKLHFQEDVPVSKIALVLDSTSYKVKLDIERIILGLRKGLLRNGINYQQAKELMEESW